MPSLALPDVLTATYEVVGRDPARLAETAEEVAVSMTVGSWTDLKARDQERLRDYLGQVVGIEAGPPPRFKIAYPVRNVTPHLSALLTVVFGKLSLDGAIRLVDLDLPDSWTRHLPGPRHGVAGLRRRLGVPDRPLLMSIFKSENGRTLDEFQEALQDQWAGGADIVKDDEIFMADQWAPASARVAAAHELAARAARDGRRPVYVVNLAPYGRDAVETAARLLAEGAEAFLVSPWTMGLDTLSALARLPERPLLFAHPAFAGALSGSPTHGLSPRLAMGDLMRLGGADGVIFPSPYGSVTLAPEDALAIGRACRDPSPRLPVWPAPSAGIHPGLVGRVVRDFGHDVIINAGGAIHGHPMGTAAGARAFRQALDALSGGVASVPAELEAALARWGGSLSS